MAASTLASEKFFDWVLSLYRSSLHWVLDHPTLTLIVLFLTIALNVVLIIKIPKGFFPVEDTGAISGGSARAAGFILPGDERFHSADRPRDQE